MGVYKSETMLRVKIHLADIEDNVSHLVPDFYSVPRQGDLIDMKHFIDKSSFTEKQYEKILSLNWKVWYVKWSKDDIGFFVEIICEGE